MGGVRETEDERAGSGRAIENGNFLYLLKRWNTIKTRTQQCFNLQRNSLPFSVLRVFTSSVISEHMKIRVRVVNGLNSGEIVNPFNECRASCQNSQKR